MDGFSGIGKLLLVVGGLTMVMGAALLVASQVPFLGRLPGDIVIQKDGATFYFPIVTMILVSIVLSVVLNLVTRFFR